MSLRSSRIAADSLESSAIASLSNDSTGVQAASISLTSLRSRCLVRRRSRRSGRHVVARQVEREGAAFARRAEITRISPPSNRAISRLIERPRPVPPYLRLVVPSACWKGFEDDPLLLSGDADAGIAYREGDHFAGPVQRFEMIGFIRRRRRDAAARPCLLR